MDAAARAVARKVFEASDDGGGTCSSRMPLAQPCVRINDTMVAFRAGEEVWKSIRTDRKSANAKVEH
jgi:hypothetical protein